MRCFRAWTLEGDTGRDRGERRKPTGYDGADGAVARGAAGRAGVSGGASSDGTGARRRWDGVARSGADGGTRCAEAGFHVYSMTI